jgi:hypothetical protein
MTDNYSQYDLQQLYAAAQGWLDLDYAGNDIINSTLGLINSYGSFQGKDEIGDQFTASFYPPFDQTLATVGLIGDIGTDTSKEITGTADIINAGNNNNTDLALSAGDDTHIA